MSTRIAHLTFMILIACPNCKLKSEGPSLYPGSRTKLIRKGSYHRKSDGKNVQRYRCLPCRKGFSTATLSACYRQKKRHKNTPLNNLFASGISKRRSAFLLNISRTTVARKLPFLGSVAKKTNVLWRKGFPPSTSVQFDDIETFVHTKLKPYSIIMMIENKTRRILGFEVCQMPAKGKLSKRSLKKYGVRPDFRKEGRRKLFRDLQQHVHPNAEIHSDQSPHYPGCVKDFFPSCEHKRHKGRKPAAQGLGELKVGVYDPLFSFNHSAAMLRANINRLMRKTWCTSKRADRLRDHLEIYVAFHNKFVLGELRT